MNVASRFEGLAKVYGVTAIVGERTIAKTAEFPAFELDSVRVVGRETPTPIFTFQHLLDGNPERVGKLLPTHNEFLSLFRKGQWDAAEAAIAECRSAEIAAMDHYYSVFAARIAEYRATPPPPGWDGVFTSREK